MRPVLPAIRAELLQLDPLRGGFLVFHRGVVLAFAIATLKCNLFACHIVTPLLHDFRYRTGAYRAAALANREAQAFVHGDRSDQLDFERVVVEYVQQRLAGRGVLKFARLLVDGDAREALERVGLGSRLRHVPSELSGGQKQRVAIARALINDPTLLLADEPTGNLDTASSGEILKLLGALNDAGRTVVLITHEEEVAAFAKRVVRMRDGRVESDRVQRSRTEVTA